MAAQDTTDGTVNVRRGAMIAWISALVLLIFVAAFDNQWTLNWRERQGTGDGSGVRSWTGEPIRDVSALSWRISPGDGESGRVFAGNTTAVVLAILLTGCLIWLVCRGIGTTRGRLPLFFGVWFSVAAATAVALIVGELIAHEPDLPLGRGTTYYIVTGIGLGFGLFIGWLVGVTAVIVYNVSGGLDDLALSPGYQPPAASSYDYGMSSLAADYGIAPTQTQTAPGAGSYYPPTSPDPGETPTKPIDPFNRGY